MAFVGTASVIYRFKKTLSGAVVGLCSAVCAMTAVMILANMFITPYYMGTTMEAVRSLIPTLLLPFNLLKGVINVGAVLLLYKPMSRALRKAGILGSRKNNSLEQNAVCPMPRSVSVLTGMLVTVDAIALISAALMLIFRVLGGNFTFGM